MTFQEWSLGEPSWMKWEFRQSFMDDLYIKLKFHKISSLINDKFLDENKIWMDELKIISHDAWDFISFWNKMKFYPFASHTH